MAETSQSIHRERMRWSLPGNSHSPTLPLGQIARILHGAAGSQVRGLGIGVRDLHQQDLTWMLSRFKAFVPALPQEGEELEVVTWPWKADALRYYRDYELRGNNGRPLTLATSQWLLVHLSQRRPVRVGDISALLPPVPDTRAIEENLRKMNLSQPRWERREVHIEARHLDVNRHVNNAHYLSWITELLEQQGWPGSDGGFSFEIHYLAEARLGDTVSVEVSEMKNGLPVEAVLLRKDDETALTHFRISPDI